MRREDVPAELVELAGLHGIDLEPLPAELSDEHLEGVVGGKAPFWVGGPAGPGWNSWGWGWNNSWSWGGPRPVFPRRAYWATGARWWW
jgi:hypothetical protein